MLLDELVGVIETLKERIKSHRDVLSANEYRTRVSLIDPLLCVLGWDVADPLMVTLEYHVRGKRADYALLKSEGIPMVVLEAKSLGTSLSDNELMQMLTYANADNVPFAGLTDGNHWEIYSVFDQKPLSERLMLKTSVAQDPTSQLSLQFLLLWRRNIVSGSPKPAAKPIIEISPPYIEEPKPDPPTPPNVNSMEGWTTLAEFKAVKGTDPPTAIRFGVNDEHPLGNWNSVIVRIAEHLVTRKLLKAERCPVSAGPKSIRRLVNTEPRHSSGREFVVKRALSNGLYVDLNYSSSDCIKMGTYLLGHFGQDPSQVWLKTD